MTHKQLQRLREFLRRDPTTGRVPELDRNELITLLNEELEIAEIVERAEVPILSWKALPHAAKEDVLEILFEKGSHPMLKDAVEIAWKILRRLG